MRRTVLASFTIGAAMLPMAMAAQTTEMVVDLPWLAARLKDPNVVVISTDEPPAYERGHIPGARQLGHQETLGGDHRLATPAALAAALSRVGARDDAHIVLYGSSAMETGWLYMVLAAIGHGDHVSVLNGNIDAWRARKLPVETTTPPAASGRLTPRPAPEVIVDATWVRERLQSPAVKVLDVRTTDERTRGFIPGSTLVLWQDLYADRKLLTFKSKEEIRSLLAKTGLTGDQQAVTYCAVGMRASLMYFAARHVGIPTRVYVGSWQDWSSGGNPVAKLTTTN